MLVSTAGVSSRSSWLCIDVLPSFFSPGGCCLQKTLLLPYYYWFKVWCITSTAGFLCLTIARKTQAQPIYSWLKEACSSTLSNKHRDTLTLKSGTRGWVTETGTTEDGARGWAGLCVYLQNYSLETTENTHDLTMWVNSLSQPYNAINKANQS